MDEGGGGSQTTTPNDLRDGNLLLHDGRLFVDCGWMDQL